jgi:hypothetical protein
MIDREKLQRAVTRGILPYALETAEEEEEDAYHDPFVIETASFLSQEILESGIEITDEQAELDDEELENLPLTNLLFPHLQELLSVKDPINIISSILQIYTAPDPDPELHRHVRYGDCEVQAPKTQSPAPNPFFPFLSPMLMTPAM